jgi:hypothetical protein
LKRKLSSENGDNGCGRKLKTRKRLAATIADDNAHKARSSGPETSSSSEQIVSYTFVGNAERGVSENNETSLVRDQTNTFRIPVPAWRVVTAPSIAHSVEGTELLGNEVFAKRHQKQEIEEKRIIRWDAQRRREAEKRREMRQSSRYNAYLGPKQQQQVQPEFSTTTGPATASATHVCHCCGAPAISGDTPGRSSNEKAQLAAVTASSSAASVVLIEPPDFKNIQAVEVRKSLPSKIPNFTVQFHYSASEDLYDMDRPRL